jgi:type II secretory pathway component GspD/PulD (secretin)
MFFRLAALLPLSSQGVAMNSPRLTALVPVLMVMALPLGAGEAGKTPAATPPLSAEQEAFWKEFQNGALSKAQIDAEAKYVTARAAFQDGRFVEARDLVDEAIRIFPSHAGAQQLREQILAVLTQRESRLSVATTLSQAQQNVKSQEIAVRLASLMDSGDKKMKAGDYAGAELDYDRVEVGLRSFPYQFDWGTLPTQVAAKKLESRNRSREAKIKKDAQQHEDAAERARQQADAQEAALKAKVDELLSRAEASYSRKDYKRAEVDAWNAYELDRRREDARSLYLSARRAGHNQFDDRYVPTRLETLSRVHEELHKSLIPQNELLVYPEDWQIRALRKPQEIGSAKVEPWVAQLNERLNQKVTFNFEDETMEDVIKFLRLTTGTTIILAPDVTAAPPVKLKVDGMRFGDALKWILEGASLKMALQNEAIYISSQPIVGAIALRMYDVTDLMSPVQDFPGKELAIGGGGGGAGGAGGGAFSLFKMDAAAADKGGNTPDDLIKFIKDNIAKTTWETPGMGIDMRGGSTLFISQTPETHALVEQLLASMRNTQSLQVNISVQILDVKKGFFEEIGVQLTDQTGGDGANAAVSSSPQANLINGTPTPGQVIAPLVPVPGDPDGYVRLNDTLMYNGAYTQRMPANGSTASTSQSNVQRGLNADLSYHPLSFLGQDQINALFSAFEQETDAQILEHPTLTCFNGQRANTSFMHQRAYIADYDIVNAAFDPKIEVLNFGNILDVRPVVSSDRKYITMEIRPTSVLPVDFQVEILNGFRTAGVPPVVIGLFFYPIELPNVEVRELRSTVMMPDKGTLMVGGFSKALRQQTHSGIPFLSHIPFLGRLFSQNGTYDENRRIFFLLNAEILDLGEKEKLR